MLLRPSAVEKTGRRNDWLKSAFSFSLHTHILLFFFYYRLITTTFRSIQRYFFPYCSGRTHKSTHIFTVTVIISFFIFFLILLINWLILFASHFVIAWEVNVLFSSFCLRETFSVSVSNYCNHLVLARSDFLWPPLPWLDTKYVCWAVVGRISLVEVWLLSSDKQVLK